MEKEIELEPENVVIYSGGGAVNSVNGYTGDVVLTTSDLENTSDYQTGTEVESAISTAIAGKQDTLTAGNNITISNNTISATDTTYSAGTGLDLTGTTFSVDTATIATQQDVSDEATARENADINLQGQIDAISASSDVTDIVGTYAELEAYDTTHLKDSDIIKVLQDESQNDETTYYRWSTTTETFTLIGEEGPYYTKSQTDTLLSAKQDTLTAGSNISISAQNEISATDTTYSAGSGLDLTGTTFSVDTTTIQPKLTAGSNITIDSNNEISATDTTYSNFVGTDGTAVGTAGLVPAPATTDAGKFLKADGTWETVGGGGITELTSADYNYPTASPTQIAAWLLPDGLYKTTTEKVYWSQALYDSNVTFIKSTASNDEIYVFCFDNANHKARIYKSSFSQALQYDLLSKSDIVDNLTTANPNFPLSANQGKVLKDLVDSIAIRASGAPTTSTVGQVGTLYEDTTNGDLYICTDATNPYVWEEVGGSAGPTVVQTTGTSTTDVMSQNAVTSMVFKDPSTRQKIQIGRFSDVTGDSGVGLGDNVIVRPTGGVAIGAGAVVPTGKTGAIALGAYSGGSNLAVGEMNIGSTAQGYGYNSSNYRLLTGLYDPQSAHDAATKGYVDGLVGDIESALNIINNGGTES